MFYFRHLSKRNNFLDFLFAFLDDVVFPMGVILVIERICSRRSHVLFSFSLKIEPFKEEEKSENGKAAPSKCKFLYIWKLRSNCACAIKSKFSHFGL